MRGRFRPGGNNVTGGDMIGNNNLLGDNEIPNYDADSINFSLKVFSGGIFNEISTEYVGGRYDYFDMCSSKNMCMEEMEVMVAELGYGKGFYALWYVIPGNTIRDGLMPIEGTHDLRIMVDLVVYSKLIRAYVTSKPFSEFGVFGGEGLMEKLSGKAYTWLAAKPRSQWSRSAFRETCKCDMFVNNNCEVFNKTINNFRHLAIVTMFKEIHKQCMERIQKRKTKIQRSGAEFCSNALKRLHKSMKMAGKARPVWNGAHKYHVTMIDGGHEIVVDLEQKTCACRKWQLTGIPCFHACACIFFLKQSPLDYMHECYKTKVYMEVYNHVLEPINGEQFWEQTNTDPLHPPEVRIAPGRPKKKRSKKNDVVESRESDPTRLKRTGNSLKCSYCGQWKHNRRSCKSRISDEKRKQREEGQINEQGYAGDTEHHDQQQSETIHGGIIRSSTAIAQDFNKNCLGVETENFLWQGKECTSLKKLQATKFRKQQSLGKKI